MIDYLVVGAGFAGAVAAERLASAGASVVVVDRRTHVGGNAFDHYDEAGLLVHRYGPHIFHTNSKRVFDYLSRFTQWRRYEHRVLASIDGQLLPIPINLDTINRLYRLKLSPDEVEAFFTARAEKRETLRTSEDVVVSRIGWDLYRRFFQGYTRKQWGLDPSELDASVIARIPTRCNTDDRYFTDSYQYMPRHGYTRLFERMLDHPRITLMLQADYRAVRHWLPHRETIYTGPVDEFFDFRFGKRGRARRTPEHRLLAPIEQARVDAATQHAHFLRLVREVHREIRPFPVAEHAEPLELLPLHADELLRVGPAALAHLDLGHRVPALDDGSEIGMGGQGFARRPGLGESAAPGAVDQADRHAQALLQLAPEGQADG